MNEKLFTMSKNGTSEYCCCVVRIGEVKPIEGSDFLGQTFINGESIVIRKDEVKEGDLLFYASNETQLNKDFLSVNNLFDMSSRELNQNYNEVEELRQKGEEEKAKRMVGFFNKHGRVRMIRLRGIPSMGFLFQKETLAKYFPKANDLNMEEMVGKDFDTINDTLFIKAYVPPIKETNRQTRLGKAQKKLNRFKRMIEGQFFFHYNTNPLAKNIHRIRPEDSVTISLKEHGTSICIANVLIKKPKVLNAVEKVLNKKTRKDIKRLKLDNSYHNSEKNKLKIEKLEKSIKPTYSIGYGNVYSSRTVIKNEYINKNIGDGFYNTDVWGIFNQIMKPYIEKGMTLYGEIVGFVPGTNKPIQGAYDYGCKPGEGYLMPYRITMKNNDSGKIKEWEVVDVYEWTKKLLKKKPELKKVLKPINILYHGTLKNLYPDVSVSEHWNEEILLRLKNDSKNFGMEMNEPLCKNVVPREGICLRIDNDEIAECFKLKCEKFLFKEAKEIDNGNVDIEMSEAYT